MTPRNRIAFLPLLTLCFPVWLAVAPPARAAGDNARAPIRIDARSVETNEKTGVAVYRGNVVIQQGRLSIRADQVEVRARKNKTESIHATGKPARLQQQPDTDGEEINAEADDIDYQVSDGMLKMRGNVSLRRGEDVFTGGVLSYDLNTKNLNAVGGDDPDSRVHAVIQPRKQTAETTPSPEHP